MADLSRTQTGVVSAVAIGVATFAAAAAGGGVGVAGLDIPLLLLAPALAAGAVGAGARRSTRVLPEGKDVVALTAVTVLGFLGLYLAGWTNRQHLADAARLLPLAVVALSALWPEPNVLRYCVLLAGGTLLGAAAEPVRSRPAVGVALVALSVALVATNRLAVASGPRLGDAARATRRRVAGEAAAVLAIVGLLAALAASLLPPPPGQGGGDGLGGGNARGGRLPPPGPPVRFDDRLDVTLGRGERGDGPVLLVDAPRPDVWRATTYDHWDGAAWTRSPETRRDIDGEQVAPGIGDTEADIGDLGLYQSVTVLARSADVLPAAARPTFASSDDVDVSQGRDATLYPSVPLLRGEHYLLFSDQPTAGAAALRAATGAVPTSVADVYLQLPQVAPRVRALAADVAATGATTYDKARAVEAWIDGHTTVTDDAAALPAGTDPLEAFLLDNRKGPPERAATAMVVMLRALGVPARMAVGFLPGERWGPDGAFLVRADDSHAWVEVWFPEAGWQRFDPTGRAPDPRDRESVWDRLLRFLRRLWPLALAVVLLAGGLLARHGVRWWRRRADLPWSTRFFARVERAGRVRGRPRRPHETPAEYADGLARSVLPDPRMAEVGELVTVAAWSRHEPPAEDRARAEAVLRAAAKAAPVRRLRRLRRRPR